MKTEQELLFNDNKRKCCECKNIKELQEFRKISNVGYKKDYEYKCLMCIKIYHQKRYLERKQEYSDRQKLYISDPKIKEKRSISRQKYYKKNKNRMLILAKAWEQENKGRRKAIKAKYRAQLLNATPKWANMEKILQIYKDCAKIEKETGLKYEVDHIIPLQGKIVSGLHVDTNLQILLMVENRSKGNKYG